MFLLSCHRFTTTCSGTFLSQLVISSSTLAAGDFLQRSEYPNLVCAQIVFLFWQICHRPVLLLAFRKHAFVDTWEKMSLILHKTVWVKVAIASYCLSKSEQKNSRSTFASASFEWLPQRARNLKRFERHVRSVHSQPPFLYLSISISPASSFSVTVWIISLHGNISMCLAVNAKHSITVLFPSSSGL